MAHRLETRGVLLNRKDQSLFNETHRVSRQWAIFGEKKVWNSQRGIKRVYMVMLHIQKPPLYIHGFELSVKKLTLPLFIIKNLLNQFFFPRYAIVPIPLATSSILYRLRPDLDLAQMLVFLRDFVSLFAISRFRLYLLDLLRWGLVPPCSHLDLLWLRFETCLVSPWSVTFKFETWFVSIRYVVFWFRRPLSCVVSIAESFRY